MHKKTIAVACSLLLALPIALLSAQEFGREPAARTGYAKIRHAVVSLKDYVQVPALQSGVLAKLELEDGTIIKEGVKITRSHTLGNLDDRDAVAGHRVTQLEQEVAQLEYDKSDLAIATAEKTVDVAYVEVVETRNVNKNAPGAIPKTTERRQTLTHERSVIEAQTARHDKVGAAKMAEFKEAQVDLAALKLDHHQIRSPIDGEVVQVYRKVGEWVNAGDPLLRIIDLQTLRVEGFLKINDYLRQDIAGQPVIITIQMPRGRTATFESTISYVSPLVQASGDYRVMCEVTNKMVDGYWVMLPGMDAELTIELKPSQVAVTR